MGRSAHRVVDNVTKLDEVATNEIQEPNAPLLPYSPDIPYPKPGPHYL